MILGSIKLNVIVCEDVEFDVSVSLWTELAKNSHILNDNQVNYCDLIKCDLTENEIKYINLRIAKKIVEDFDKIRRNNIKEIINDPLFRKLLRVIEKEILFDMNRPLAQKSFRSIVGLGGEIIDLDNAELLYLSNISTVISNLKSFISLELINTQKKENYNG